ncbi:MAG: DMT family transporter [Eggerthellaceae bacterium]
MDWIVLIASGVMESVWAISLGKSDGFTHMAPTLVFLAAMTLSMLGLAYATKTLPIGTAYAVWVGIGAALTMVYGMATGSEPANAARILLIVGLIACVIGLKLVSSN